MTKKQTNRGSAANKSGKADKHEKAMLWVRERNIRALEHNESLFPRVEAVLNETAEATTAKTRSRQRKAA